MGSANVSAKNAIFAQNPPRLFPSKHQRKSKFRIPKAIAAMPKGKGMTHHILGHNLLACQRVLAAALSFPPIRQLFLIP